MGISRKPVVVNLVEEGEEEMEGIDSKRTGGESV